MIADKREFVDTNVLVYAHDESAGPKRSIARDLLIRLWDSRSGALSVQVLQEFYVTVTRKIPVPLDLSKARSIVETLGLWSVHAPQPGDVVYAIDIQIAHQLAFWDAMIVNSASTLECGCIWSEDLSHGQMYQGIPVKNPFVA